MIKLETYNIAGVWHGIYTFSRVDGLVEVENLTTNLIRDQIWSSRLLEQVWNQRQIRRFINDRIEDI